MARTGFEPPTLSLGPGPLLSTQQGEGKKKKKRKERERAWDTTQHAAI